MLRRIVQFFAANTFITLPLWVLLIAFGLLSYLVLLPREGFPLSAKTVLLVSTAVICAENKAQ